VLVRHRRGGDTGAFGRSPQGGRRHGRADHHALEESLRRRRAWPRHRTRALAHSRLGLTALERSGGSSPGVHLEGARNWSHLPDASTPEDLGHLLCRPALPVLTVATTVPGTPGVRGAPAIKAGRLRIWLELFGGSAARC